MPLAPLNILTLQRQTVFACPWVCGQTLQSVVSMFLNLPKYLLPFYFFCAFLRYLCGTRGLLPNTPFLCFHPFVFSFCHPEICFLVSSSVLSPHESCSLLLNFQSQNPEWTLPSTVLHIQCFSWPTLSLLLLLLCKAPFILPCFPERCWKHMTGIKFSFFT